MKWNKGSVVEEWKYGKFTNSIADRRAFKVNGLTFTFLHGTSFERKNPIPPHLLISEAERRRSIGTQLTMEIKENERQG